MSKATAIAHPIQGLIKYHGMKNKQLRLPYHDSISVCMQELYTITTVQTTELENDIFIINGERPKEKDEKRMNAIVDRIREISKRGEKILAVSKNMIGKEQHSYEIGKGLGYSSSGGAALAAATAKAFELDWLIEDKRKLSTLARRLSGSAARSTVGGFARWYASEIDEESFAEQIAKSKDLSEYRMIVYPFKESTNIKTDEAHKEVNESPLFEGRLNYIDKALDEMMNAIKNKNISQIGYLAEKDSLILHAVTMTGNNHMFALEPESIKIYKAIKRMRGGTTPEEIESNTGLHAYVSWDTGPSTYINTHEKYVKEIVSELSKVIDKQPIICSIGEEVKLSNENLF